MIIGYSIVIVLIFMYIAFKIIARRYKETKDEKENREWLKNHAGTIEFKEFKERYSNCRNCNSYYLLSSETGCSCNHV